MTAKAHRQPPVPCPTPGGPSAGEPGDRQSRPSARRRPAPPRPTPGNRQVPGPVSRPAQARPRAPAGTRRADQRRTQTTPEPGQPLHLPASPAAADAGRAAGQVPGPAARRRGPGCGHRKRGPARRQAARTAGRAPPASGTPATRPGAATPRARPVYRQRRPPARRHHRHRPRTRPAWPERQAVPSRHRQRSRYPCSLMPMCGAGRIDVASPLPAAEARRSYACTGWPSTGESGSRSSTGSVTR